MAARAGSRVVVFVIGIAFALLFPTESHAQYMYLDTNGDGLHSAADVVAPSGPTDVGVWLRTNANRDGSPGICFSGDGDLTISSYEVILSAHNGNVSWDALTNSVPQFSNDQGTVASGSDAHVAYGGSVLPPGTYHLANVRVTVTSGTPSIEILTSTGLSPLFTTSFSSACSGLDLDNALKLGSDWFDADGVPYGGTANQDPVMGLVADMSIAEGAVAEQTIHATDPEGAPLTFVKISGPAYMSVSTLISGPPEATGLIRLEPDFFSAGSTQGVVGASDGFVATSATFVITVQNTPRPPILGYVAPMTDVADDVPVSQIITADDPDGEASQVRFDFPVFRPTPWVTALTHSPQTSFRAEGEIVVNPPPGTAPGVYSATVLAFKSTAIDSAAFQITVANPGGNSGPLILEMPDIGVSAGETRHQGFTVYDPDADTIVLTKDAGPPYMSVENTGQVGTTTNGLVTLTPGVADVGGAIGVIGASDGVVHSEERFSILVVDPTQTFATQLTLRGDPGDYVTQGQSYEYHPIGSTFTGRVGGSGEVNLFVTGPGGPADYWSLAFMPPDSQLLALGFYANAHRSGGFVGTPGLDVFGQGRGCNTLTGHFEIKQIDVGPDGALRAFWARFQQHCEDAAPAMTGEVRINVNADLAVTAPLQGSALVGGVATFPISAVSATGSPLTLRIVPPAPEGAEFIDYGNGTGEFTWRPLAPLAPTLIAFEARDAEDHVDRSSMLLSADVRTVTSLKMYSDPSDPVGYGQDLTFGENEVQPNLYPWEPNRVAFQAFGAGSYYSLVFRAADNGRIVPGVYEGATGETYHTPGTPTLEVGPGYSPCGPVTGRFEVVEATYDDQGMLTGFDAYFSQNCGMNETIAITGQIRWRAHPAIEVDVPLSRALREGETSVIIAVAPPDLPVSYSIEGLPLGATFSDLGDNTARLSWTPDLASAGVYQMRLHASRSDGATESIPLRWNVLDLNRPPVADAGGPYDGVAGQPVEFDGSGSNDPDGDPIVLYWDFGDSTTTASGVNVFHTYAAAGVYAVSLLATNLSFSVFDFDSTTASIHANLPARLFVARGNRDIRLSSGKPAWCAQLEAVHSSFHPSDVLLSSLALISDSTSGPVSRIHAIPGKPSTIVDTDGNGIEELTACFAKQDLQQLFAYVSGRSVERVIVEGTLSNGSQIRAVMQIEVVGSSGKTSLAATPNPLNPETMITYWLPRGSKIELRIFDVSGRLVATLADGAAPPGYGSVRWKPDRVASGVYYANLVTETERRSLRLVVLK